MIHAVLSVLFLLPSVLCIRRSDIFPFGTPAGDEKLDRNKEDASSREIRLGTNIKFFDTEYDTVFVSVRPIVNEC